MTRSRRSGSGSRLTGPVGDRAGGAGISGVRGESAAGGAVPGRHAVSGAKSDTGDAHMLADMVRTDAHQLRPVAADSQQAQAVKVVARAHKTLIWERTGRSSGCATSCGLLPGRAGCLPRPGPGLR